MPSLSGHVLTFHISGPPHCRGGAAAPMNACHSQAIPASSRNGPDTPPFSQFFAFPALLLGLLAPSPFLLIKRDGGR